MGGFATAALLAVAACGRAGGPAAGQPSPDDLPKELPLARLYVLEMSGIPPEDTTVTFRAGQPYSVILRHGAPDNSVFVELTFPAAVFGDSTSLDSVTVAVHPRPGIYAVDVTTTLPPDKGATIRFKYPVHFSPPLEAVSHYGSAVQLERALSIARLEEGTNYELLRSTRPSVDNLEAPLAGPGTYLVAAPR